MTLTVAWETENDICVYGIYNYLQIVKLFLTKIKKNINRKQIECTYIEFK